MLFISVSRKDAERMSRGQTASVRINGEQVTLRRRGNVLSWMAGSTMECREIISEEMREVGGKPVVTFIAMPTDGAAALLKTPAPQAKHSCHPRTYRAKLLIWQPLAVRIQSPVQRSGSVRTTSERRQERRLTF